MNNRMLLACAGIVWACFANAQQDFTIKGKLNGLKEEVKILLTYKKNGAFSTDSTITVKGQFTLKGKVEEPHKVTLLAKPLDDDGLFSIEKHLNRDVQEFFIEKGSISVAGNSVKQSKIVAGQAQDDHLRLKGQLAPYRQQLDPLSLQMAKAIQENDTAARAALIPQMRAIRKQMNHVEEKFIEEHGNSFVSLYLLGQRVSTLDIDLSKIMPLYNSLTDEMKETDAGQAIAQKIDAAARATLGQPIENLKQADLNGNLVEVASLNGKYVLVDFWASWCGPCRAENPHLKKAYAQFKEKNFEIMGISLDTDRTKWLAAIEKDGLPWIHVSDLKGFKNEAAQAYGITAIPQNLLIDPNGIIIARNLRGDSLMDKLNEIIK